MRKVLAAIAAGAALALAGVREGIELNEKAHDLYLEAKYADAEVLYRKALEEFDGPGTDRASTLENLGVLLRVQGRYAEARVKLEDARTQLEALTGAESVATAKAIGNLAGLYWSCGELDRAEEMALRADVILEQWQEAGAAERANNRQILAAVFLGQRRYADASRLLLALLQNADGRTAVRSYGNLAAAAIGMGDTALAEEYARKGVERARQVLPPGHPGLAVVLNNLAQTCRLTGSYVEVEKYYREAIGIWEAALGGSHPDVARGLMNLAAFFHERGREAGAEKLYLRAVEILEAALGPGHALVLVARDELADVLRGQMRYTEAGKLARRALEEMQLAFKADDPRMIRAWVNYARLLSETKRTAEAKRVLARALR